MTILENMLEGKGIWFVETHLPTTQLTQTNNESYIFSTESANVINANVMCLTPLTGQSRGLSPDGLILVHTPPENTQ